VYFKKAIVWFPNVFKASAPVLWSAGVLNQKINQIAIISTLPYSNTPKTAEVGRNVSPYIKEMQAMCQDNKVVYVQAKDNVRSEPLVPGCFRGPWNPEIRAPN